MTREYTLPSLVLHNDRNMLEQIAVASGLSVPVMLTQGSSAAAILAYLYMRSETDMTAGFKVFMREVAAGNSTLTFPRVLDSVKVPLVYKLALELGDEDAAIASQASCPDSY